MIYCLGLSSELKNIQQNLDHQNAFTFRNADDHESIRSLEEAELFLIGPSVEQPVKLVQRIVAIDKLLSIIILADSRRYTQIKQSLQFSLSIGKNTSCVVFNPGSNYTSIFQDGIIRTRQKRKFSSFVRATELKLSSLASAHVTLDNLGQVLEHAPIGALLINEDFDIVGANKSSRKTFSLHGSKVSLRSLFSEKYINAIKNAKQEDAFITIEDFHGKFYEVSASSVSHGELANTILLINDITERVERDRTVNAILESLPQIAWTAQPDGNLSYFNHGWHNYTGKTSAEGLNQSWVCVVHPEDATLVTASWKESVVAGKSFQHSLRLRRFDGEYRWHLVRGVPVRAKSGQITMWVGTSTDIHDQVLLTENLERTVKERTKLLEETNAELEQFAHISSHDLQEPLRKIETFADIIKGQSNSLNEDASRYIDKIINTSSRMSRLLKDLLNFTKINQQEAEETIDLNDTIKHIKEDLELLLTQNNATLYAADLPIIKGRPLQIRQLFYNLINNSIKYRKPDAAPVVSVKCNLLDQQTQSNHKALSGGAYWHIVVKDNGIGFEQKYADQIFTVFQRLHTRSVYEGTGIGLAIAKKVVINHGGEIFATSSPGNGAEFHVILPAI